MSVYDCYFCECRRVPKTADKKLSNKLGEILLEEVNIESKRWEEIRKNFKTISLKNI